MFTVPGNRDLVCPREGESLRPWITEATRRLNRRIHGLPVVESFGDILIRSPEIPPTNPDGYGQLTQDLYGCESASAVFATYDADGNMTTGADFTVFDPANKSAGWLEFRLDENGVVYVPSGTCFDWSFNETNGHYEIKSFGACCLNPDSSSAPGPPQECGMPCPPNPCTGDTVLVASCPSGGGQSIATWQLLDTTQGLPGITNVTLAKLTPGGTEGTQIFTNGILTFYNAPT